MRRIEGHRGGGSEGIAIGSVAVRVPTVFRDRIAIRVIGGGAIQRDRHAHLARVGRQFGGGNGHSDGRHIRVHDVHDHRGGCGFRRTLIVLHPQCHRVVANGSIARIGWTWTRGVRVAPVHPVASIPIPQIFNDRRIRIEVIGTCAIHVERAESRLVGLIRNRGDHRHGHRLGQRLGQDQDGLSCIQGGVGIACRWPRRTRPTSIRLLAEHCVGAPEAGHDRVGRIGRIEKRRIAEQPCREILIPIARAESCIDRGDSLDL